MRNTPFERLWGARARVLGAYCMRPAHGDLVYACSQLLNTGTALADGAGPKVPRSLLPQITLVFGPVSPSGDFELLVERVGCGLEIESALLQDREHT